MQNASQEMAVPAIIYALLMNIVLLLYVAVVRRRQYAVSVK